MKNGKTYITGIILAGGKSSRMGKEKGLLELNGITFTEHIIETLKPVCNQIIIIANKKEYEQFGYTVYGDLVKDCGPVAGIYTGLAHSKTNINIILSCDIPFVTTELLQFLLRGSKNYDVTIPAYNGKTGPLTGIYTKSCLPVFREQLDQKQLKLHQVLKHLKVRVVEVKDRFPEEVFYNIKTPDDLKYIKQLNI